MATMPNLPDVRGSHLAPVIVGLGDPILADEAVGLHVMGELREFGRSWLGRVEFVDAARPGLTPTASLRDRPAMVIVGTLSFGHAPGTVHVLSGRDLLRRRARHPNRGPAGDIVAMLSLLDALGARPAWVTVVGIEPGRIERGVGLTEAVRAAVPVAVRRAHDAVEAMIEVFAREGAGPGLAAQALAG
jgi:hydrogenase maturation protease